MCDSCRRYASRGLASVDRCGSTSSRLDMSSTCSPRGYSDHAGGTAPEEEEESGAPARWGLAPISSALLPTAPLRTCSVRASELGDILASGFAKTDWALRKARVASWTACRPSASSWSHESAEGYPAATAATPPYRAPARRRSSSRPVWMGTSPQACVRSSTSRRPALPPHAVSAREDWRGRVVSCGCFGFSACWCARECTARLEICRSILECQMRPIVRPKETY
jgi:hypothetical protein